MDDWMGKEVVLPKAGKTQSRAINVERGKK